MINEEILKVLQEQGIKKGDMLLVSSGIKQFAKNICFKYSLEYNKFNVNKVLNEFINTLQKIITKEGTLLFPTYNWGWCRGEDFIYENTIGVTGYLGNCALERDDFKRTQHPIYSFAVWGKYQDYLAKFDNIDSWGKDSPFEFLYQEKAKNIFINCNSFYTFKHYVEECIGVDYRYMKKFLSTYERNGKREEKEYTMYVRNLSMGIESDGPATVKLLHKKSCCAYFELFSVKCGIIDMYNSFDIIKEDILNNKSKNLIKHII